MAGHAGWARDAQGLEVKKERGMLGQEMELGNGVEGKRRDEQSKGGRGNLQSSSREPMAASNFKLKPRVSKVG